MNVVPRARPAMRDTVCNITLHSSDIQNLMGYDTVQSCRCVPTVRRTTSTSKTEFLRGVSNCLPDCNTIV
jgi:hypothetical protein